jgi:hypothetical protein
MPDALKGYRTRSSGTGHYVLVKGMLSERLDLYLDEHPIHEALYQWKCYYLVALLIQCGRLIVEGESPLWLTIPNSTSQEGLEIFTEWCRQRVDLRLRNKPAGSKRQKMRWQRYTNIFLQCGFKEWKAEAGQEVQPTSYAKLGGVSVVMTNPELQTVNDFLNWRPFLYMCEFFHQQPQWLSQSMPRRIHIKDLSVEEWQYQEDVIEEVSEACMETTTTIAISEEEIDAFMKTFDF